MNCYNHQNTPAVGICKHCNKGICPTCLTDLGDGIACTASCIEQVEMINALIERNKKTQSTIIGSRNSTGLLYIAMGVLMLIVPILWFKNLDPFLIGMGVLCLAYGIYTLIKTTALRDRNDNF